jgi:hypothetical protein
VSFNYLLMGGEPESLENYRYILGRQEADFHMSGTGTPSNRSVSPWWAT